MLPSYRQLQLNPAQQQRLRRYKAPQINFTTSDTITENTDSIYTDSDQVNEKTTAALDTACNILHLQKLTNTMTPQPNAATVTATGHLERAIHVGPATIKIGKVNIPVLKAMATPKLYQPLVAVRKIANNHDVLITGDKVHVSPKHTYTPRKLQATARNVGRVYQIPISLKKTTACNAEARSFPRSHYVNKNKPIPLPSHLQLERKTRAPLLPSPLRN